ncbi:hypothetical protein [Actinosynnema mirum]|uniref:Uncharacterized protein n=1 Tax=Actinosynnema mirum (strain ATCC 29888 / DSM 43827 / JCM 3225 / NBRC 14064 / NCIMB 13271 / NRRL B-12336 / IMRU 3971 / 101) TaxID=446462 RepID=C6WBA5_ACTMD|nr:hypothetical protein [Actinosynnema mirum]ACU39396.1 hypothetical protein Amir_5578 [Actinosynnema mirum DSM 43827]
MDETRAIARMSEVHDHARADMLRQDATALGYIVAVLATAGVVSQVAADLPGPVLYAILLDAVPAVRTAVAAAGVLRARFGSGVAAAGSWPHAAEAASASELAEAYRDADEALLVARQARAVSRIAADRARALEVPRRWLVRTLVALPVLGALGGIVELVLAVAR